MRCANIECPNETSEGDFALFRTDKRLVGGARGVTLLVCRPCFEALTQVAGVSQRLGLFTASKSLTEADRDDLIARYSVPSRQLPDDEAKANAGIKAIQNDLKRLGLGGLTVPAKP